MRPWPSSSGCLGSWASWSCQVCFRRVARLIRGSNPGCATNRSCRAGKRRDAGHTHQRLCAPRKRPAFGQNAGGAFTTERSVTSSQRRHSSPWRQWMQARATEDNVSPSPSRANITGSTAQRSIISPKFLARSSSPETNVFMGVGLCQSGSMERRAAVRLHPKPERQFPRGSRAPPRLPPYRSRRTAAPFPRKPCGRSRVR